MFYNRRHHDEKLYHQLESQPLLTVTREKPRSNGNPAQPQLNKFFFKKNEDEIKLFQEKQIWTVSVADSH